MDGIDKIIKYYKNCLEKKNKMIDSLMLSIDECEEHNKSLVKENSDLNKQLDFAKKIINEKQDDNYSLKINTIMLKEELDKLNKIILTADDIDSENKNENMLLKTKVESLENELDISRTDVTNHFRQFGLFGRKDD